MVICLERVQTCIWPSWCHCHWLSLASVKSRLVLPFWYRLTRVVLYKGPLNGCVCVCAYIHCLLVIICFSIYSFFFTFPYSSPPLLIFSFDNRPAPFWGQLSLKCWLSLFLCFRLVVHLFWLANACFCCVGFSFYIPNQEIGLRKRLQNDLFCVEWDVKPQLSQSDL